MHDTPLMHGHVVCDAQQTHSNRQSINSALDKPTKLHARPSTYPYPTEARWANWLYFSLTNGMSASLNPQDNTWLSRYAGMIDPAQRQAGLRPQVLFVFERSHMIDIVITYSHGFPLGFPYPFSAFTWGSANEYA